MTTKIIDSLNHNLLFIIESVFTWFLVGTAHVIGLTINEPPLTNVLPYVQLIVYILAAITSILTIYKISKEIKK